MRIRVRCDADAHVAIGAKSKHWFCTLLCTTVGATHVREREYIKRTSRERERKSRGVVCVDGRAYRSVRAPKPLKIANIAFYGMRVRRGLTPAATACDPHDTHVNVLSLALIPYLRWVYFCY